MNTPTKPGYSRAFWYGFFGFFFGLVFVVLATVIVLLRTGTPITLENFFKAQLGDAVLLLIDTLPIIFALLFGALGRRQDIYVWRRDDFNRTARGHAAEIDRLNDQSAKQVEEITMLNDELARQARESQEAQSNIQRAKREWEASLDSVEDLVVLTDDTGKIIRCNRATTRAFQTDFAQILGMQIDELFFGSSGTGEAQFPADRAELQFPQMEGWFEVMNHPLSQATGQPGKIYLIRNITDRKQVALSLDRQRQYYEALIKNSPIAIVTLNMELRVVDCNPAFEKLFGFQKQEIFGKGLDNLIAPEDFGEEARSLSHAVQRGEVVHKVTRRRSKDGSLMDLEIYGLPVVLWGKQIGILAQYHDVTELLQAGKAAARAESTWIPEEIEPEVSSRLAAAIAAGAVAKAFSERADEGEPAETEALAEQDAALAGVRPFVDEENLEAPPVVQEKRKTLQIEVIEGIGPVYADKLAAVGVTTTSELLDYAASRKGRQKLADETGISRELILKWVNRADLMRVPGIGEEYSDLLEAAGVDTVKELRNRNPENLHLALADVNASKKLVRRLPHFSEVETWIKAAKQLEAVVTY